MRLPLLTGIALTCAAAAFAGQTSQTPGQTTGQTTGTAASGNGTMTLVGCIGGGATASDPFMLSDASLAKVGTTSGSPTTATTGSGTAASSSPAATGTLTTPPAATGTTGT